MAIDPNGRHAVTHYRVIERLKQNFSLVECELETGRTHQIRVHMASINHPLLGDEVYGPKQKPFATQGQVLHAGYSGSTTQSPENIWNGMQTFQTIFRRF